MTKSVSVDCREIVDVESFHDVFAKAFGFPEFYGRNRDAWIDCMMRLDEPFSAVSVARGEVVCLSLDYAAELKARLPDVLSDILEMAAFVNWRRIEMGEAPVMVVAAYA